MWYYPREQGFHSTKNEQMEIQMQMNISIHAMLHESRVTRPRGVAATIFRADRHTDTQAHARMDEGHSIIFLCLRRVKKFKPVLNKSYALQRRLLFPVLAFHILFPFRMHKTSLNNLDFYSK